MTSSVALVIAKLEQQQIPAGKAFVGLLVRKLLERKMGLEAPIKGNVKGSVSNPGTQTMMIMARTQRHRSLRHCPASMNDMAMGEGFGTGIHSVCSITYSLTSGREFFLYADCSNKRENWLAQIIFENISISGYSVSRMRPNFADR